jgi:hypothetical protein
MAVALIEHHQHRQANVLLLVPRLTPELLNLDPFFFA